MAMLQTHRAAQAITRMATQLPGGSPENWSHIQKWRSECGLLLSDSARQKPAHAQSLLCAQTDAKAGCKSKLAFVCGSLLF